MQSLARCNFWKFFTATWTFCLISFISWSQDEGNSSTTSTKTTTTTEHTEWYIAPWVWIVAGIVVVLLLAAIISGGRRSSSSRTTITDAGASRTIVTDTDEV